MGHSAKSQSVLVFGDGVTILRRCRGCPASVWTDFRCKEGRISWIFAAKRSLVENSRVADVIDWDGSYGCPVQTAPHSGLASNTSFAFPQCTFRSVHLSRSTLCSRGTGTNGLDHPSNRKAKSAWSVWTVALTTRQLAFSSILSPTFNSEGKFQFGQHPRGRGGGMISRFCH
jgi:hypothetical protein